MSNAINIVIERDTASPELKAALTRYTPERIAVQVRDPVVSLMKRNYERQPQNKMGGATTNFWPRASKSTHGDLVQDGVVITTDLIGVRQRLYGGVIKPVNAKLLAIPANVETYGKLPAEFPNLVYIRFGRGQDAPQGLFATRAVSTNIEPKPRGKGFKATSQELGRVAMFWLKAEVTQSANPDVIPSTEEFRATIEEALKELLPS